MARTPAAAPSRPARARRGALVAASAAAAALAAFAAGRWSGPAAVAPSGPAAAEDEPSPAEAARPPAAPLAPPEPGVRPALPPPPAAGAPPRAEHRATPEVVARVAREASERLEAARAELVERCVPAGRRNGQATPFTFNVVFDAGGREIGRGIVEDRLHRAPDVARCLRSIPIGAFRVSPPGARVGVRIPLSFP